MTDIYLHIVARMADYMATHPYVGLVGFFFAAILLFAFSAHVLGTRYSAFIEHHYNNVCAYVR